MDFANTFILWLLLAAGFAGLAAVVYKRVSRRRTPEQASTNDAS